jgi:hypothetical protein
VSFQLLYIIDIYLLISVWFVPVLLFFFAPPAADILPLFSPAFEEG